MRSARGPELGRRSLLRLLLVTAPLTLATATPVFAHGFGQRYDLPVPLSLFISGAAAAVAFSFVIIGLFVHGTPGVRVYPRVNLLRSPVGRLVAHPAMLLSLKAVSAGVFVLFLLTGLLGDQHPLRNLAPTLVWVIWWVGLAYISALLGNLWALINPWKGCFEGAEALYRRVNPGGELSRRLPYPEALGAWPAVFVFLAFSWVELVFGGTAVPANLAVMALGYSAITWTGMFLFGKERWLRSGEAFSLAFGVLARFAPTEVRVVRPGACETRSAEGRDRDGECIDCYECFARAEAAAREWNLRPYAVGLLRPERASPSMMAFVVLMLSTITFDGFMSTPAWANLESRLYALAPDLGAGRMTVVRTLGLVAFPLLFIGVYLLVSAAMRATGGGRLATGALARSFVFTLVPIALGYHLAHYLSFLLIQGQLIIPLASDPFGFGWNLLGTAGYRPDIGIVGARFAWYTAVVAIVIGHIIAVYLAHVRARDSLGDRVPALRSQYSMLTLMVGYTVVSLWILAQPIVESGVRSSTPVAAAPRGETRIPREAVLPDPETGQLREVGEGKSAKAKLTYRVLNSVFHDGTRMTVTDLLYPYMFAFGWGVRTSPSDTTYDSLIDRSTALMRERLAGVRVLKVDKTFYGFGDLKIEREIPVVEVYLNAAAGDPEQIASIAPPWSSLPWHVIALMEEAVIRAWAAFSREGAQRPGVEWLDLVRGEGGMNRLAALVEEFKRQGYVPDPLKGSVTREEAIQRWAALDKFHRKYGHFLVTNGPYLLKEWSQDAVVLQVFRDMSYPLGIGSFDAYPIPRRAYIAKIDSTHDRVEITAEVERLERFQRSYTIVREPFRNQASPLSRPDVLVCQYMVVSAAGEVVKTGMVKPGKDGVFVVEFKGELPTGLYTILIALYLNENSMNPDVEVVRYRVGGGS